MASKVTVRFPAETRNVRLLYSVRTGSGVHRASYTMDTGNHFVWGQSDRVAKLLRPRSSAEVKKDAAI
jgi:hypothetical protein